MTIYFRSTLYVDTFGVAMNNRVFIIHAAIEELQTAGYLSEQTLAGLTKDELQLVMQRALGGNK